MKIETEEFQMILSFLHGPLVLSEGPLVQIEIQRNKELDFFMILIQTSKII